MNGHARTESLRIGDRLIPGNLFLAPLAGVSDLPFREVCISFGASMTYTEMVSAEGIVYNTGKTFSLVRRSPKERFWGIQLFSSRPDMLARAVEMLSPLAPTLFDLNCGCPIPKVVKTGAGAALMRDPERVYAMVKAMREASSVPVTVKIRSGWDDLSLTYREVAQAAFEAGAGAVCLHPRTRAQGYAGAARWEHIADLKARHPSHPVIASGDILSPEAARAVLEETGCDAVLVARGALGAPWIFRQIRDLLETGGYAPISLRERVETMREHLERAIAYKGEEIACREMRKHMGWYVKGLPGAARVRERLVRASTREAYLTILEELLPDGESVR
ncbi:TIM-barrel protein, nifR3 family [Spirochaeta thermophila DSM 6578]|uniref:tRNA-dihydrouridine synthase n=1 Tax=Winmispira thermophila (strain ATCC 700085 / DSM 6578 / Z-1203) TaxID=869211 RepID=G0GD92_WINT7|nr:tRNA dihydrouridine synthase DusB [Spirochaeta thermophila]AEJ62167.1 TIM-barrel protein, nifR3 family [Spirochaeta thermophila DSM 6578]